MDLLDDVEDAERFYCSAFGLVVGRRFGTAGVELRGGSALIYLLKKREGSPSSVATNQVRKYDRHWTPVHLDIVVDDIEKAVATALSAGASIEEPVTVQRWGTPGFARAKSTLEN